MPSIKLIGYVLVLVIAVSLFFGGYYMGKQSCLVKEQKTVIAEQVRQDKEVQKIQQNEVKREIVYRDRLKVIHDATDNCLHTELSNDVVHTLCAGATGPCPGS